jgi:protein-S-isoprenylcysteine O-methyltransferase Ste14
VSRWTVTAVFVALTIATATRAVGVWRDALADPALRIWAEAGYASLRTAVVVAFSLFVFTRGPSRRPARDPVAFAACGAAVGAIVLLQGPTEGTATSLVLAGDFVALVACIWLLAAVLVLGRCFGVLPEARGLVTRGPYGVVRHPVYLGELAACAGLLLAAPTAWNLFVAAVFVGAQALRMRLEENELGAHFPEYARYAAKTPRLFPRLAIRRPGEPLSGEHP